MFVLKWERPWVRYCASFGIQTGFIRTLRKERLVEMFVVWKEGSFRHAMNQKMLRWRTIRTKRMCIGLETLMRNKFKEEQRRNMLRSRSWRTSGNGSSMGSRHSMFGKGRVRGLPRGSHMSQVGDVQRWSM